MIPIEITEDGLRNSLDHVLGIAEKEGSVADSWRVRQAFAWLWRTVRFYEEREAFFAKIIGVVDGGKYRADWEAPLTRMIRENHRLNAEVESLREELRGKRPTTSAKI